MTLEEAIDLIRSGILTSSGTWADIGAGTGLFSMALMEILEEGKVIAVDKSPHALYERFNEQLAIGNRQKRRKHELTTHPSKIELEILEADFHQPLDLPALDGIIMANALHYANDHVTVLINVSSLLKPEGSFILIEYDTDLPNPPWVPNPVSFQRFQELCGVVGLNEPIVIGRRMSMYNDGGMYVARATKQVRFN